MPGFPDYGTSYTKPLYYLTGRERRAQEDQGGVPPGSPAPVSLFCDGGIFVSDSDLVRPLGVVPEDLMAAP